MQCPRCGSINIARTRSSWFDTVVRLLTGMKRVSCRRCQWTGPIKFAEDDDFVPLKSVLKAVESAKR